MPMPLFRIMGGSGSSNSTTNSTAPNHETVTASNSSSSTQGTSSTRTTYPGLRAAANQHPSCDAPPTVMDMIARSTAGTTTSVASGPPSLAGGSNSAAALTQSMANLSISSGPPSSVPSVTSVSGANSSAATTRTVSRPGAYAVSRVVVPNEPPQVYRVIVPVGVTPGAEFAVHAGNRRVRVKCPLNSSPGQSLTITLPPETTNQETWMQPAPVTAPTSHVADATGGALPMSPEVEQVNRTAAEVGGTAQTFLVTIPPNVYPGMQFTVHVAGGQRYQVTCPANAGPNQRVRIVPPPITEEPEAAPRTQVFEVAVPPGVAPDQPFALIANGQRVLVTCPRHATAGTKIRFELPVADFVSNIQLSYESQHGGWRRTVRATDLKFQWVRIEKDNNNPAGTITNRSSHDNNEPEDNAELVDHVGEFDFSKSAFVRQMTYMEGNDARVRTGILELVPADRAVVDSRLVINGRALLSYADIASNQGRSLDEKEKWFQNICNQLTPRWEDSWIRIYVRRSFLLVDSVDAIMSLSREDMRKRWRIEFMGEPALDAGGITREFFELITAQMYDPDFGLWLPSANNQACSDINPASGLSCPDEHIVYFRFLGRILGRALFDRQLVKGHMVRTIYKHLLGWPITVEDIAAQDEDIYNALKKLTKYTSEQMSVMCIDFTVAEDRLGSRTEIELIPGGALKEVTLENLPEYLEAHLKYRMMGRYRPQLTELLLGFFDVVPEPALTVFDASELELMLCGLPKIDLEDWQANTQYSGSFEGKGKSEQVVKWFWEVVKEDFDLEMKARLLQFVTGTSGVPSRGFSVLQGVDGNIKKFTVHGVDHRAYKFPRAHTCFNRIDLPDYGSRKDLYDNLKFAVTTSCVGFGIE